MQLTDTNELAGRPNHLVVGGSFDGSDSIFSGTTTIGGFDPISRFFIGPGVVQVQPDEGVNPVKVQDINQYYGLFGQDIWSLTPNLNLIVGGRYNLAQINLSDQFRRPGQREQHLRSLQSERRLDLSSDAMAPSLWQLFRHQPRADAARIVVLERRERHARS